MDSRYHTIYSRNNYRYSNMKNDNRMDRPSLQNMVGKEGLVGCEIGVNMGLNSVEIFEYLDIEKLYLVDPYSFCGRHPEIHGAKVGKRYRMAIEVLYPWEDKCIWIHKMSSDAVNDIPDESLDFVYIDGAHLYEVVKKDIANYIKKVKKSGLIAGHDYHQPDVKRAVDESLGKVKKGKCLDRWNRKRTFDWWTWKE